MVYAGSSDLVTGVEHCHLANGNRADLVGLRGGKLLVISATALAVYRSRQHYENPLAAGLIGLAELPQDQPLTASNGKFVLEHKAGYIGLSEDKAILIAPNAIHLYPNKTDALHGRHEILRITL